MKLYLDANPIIYGIEGDAETREAISRRMTAVTESEGVVFTSRLSWLECRIKPLRDGRDDLLGLYDIFFGSRWLKLVEIDASVIAEATRICAAYNFRSPDAIHLASAVLVGADVFLTGDRKLHSFPELRVELP